MQLQYFASQSIGGTVSDSIARAQGLIAAFVQQQAFIQAVDDVFLIASFILIVSVIPVFFLRSHLKKNGRGMASLE